MGVGEYIVRVSALARFLVVGCWLWAGWHTAAGQTAVTSATNPAAGSASQSGPTTVSGTYDAGESLRVGTRQIRLLRSRQKVAVIRTPTAGIQVAAAPEQVETPGRLYRLERYLGKAAVTVYQTRRFTSLDEQTRSMRQLGDQTAADEVVPVYIHEDSGLEMIPTGKIVIKIRTEEDLARLAAVHRRLGTRVERRIRGTTDQYILAAPHTTARALFDLCALLEREPQIEWAEPDFLGQAVKESFQPDDPLFDSNQWYLKDLKVPQAWDITTGSSQVIIAVLDDGVDLKHEDLTGALPSNTGEFPNNGLDDDRNGWKDDVNGWNFHDDNSDPGPGYLLDSHGTQVAGLAVATGNNGKGIAGCAFGSRLMPLKVLRGDPREEKEDVLNRIIAEALYYAAGQTEDGRDRWRGADVISISLGFSETNLLNTALQFAVQHGRNGRGCPTFCASGNDGSGWVQHRIYGIPAGTHHFRWEVARDGSGSDGRDTVWIDSVVWPGGTAELLQDSDLPAGWNTGGEAKWTSAQNDDQGNHAMTGWVGRDSRSVRPGPLDDWQRSFLDIRKKVVEGHLDFWVWSSLQESYPSLVGDSSFTIQDWWPFATFGMPQNRRTQFICRRDELGWDRLTPLPVRKLKFMELQVVETPPQRLDELTIRLKQIEAGRDSYNVAEWDEAGWTTVFHGTNVPLTLGTGLGLPDGRLTNLVRFDFTTGFTYDPKYNLAVDICMTQTRTGVWGGFCLTSLTDEKRTIVGEEFLMLGPDHPVRWRGSQGSAQLSDWIPLAWFGSGDELRLFIDGVLTTKTSGVAQPKAGIAYPAGNQYTMAVGASTDFGLRSDYSQFGTDLDFVAPSSGGRQAISSTDRTGAKGDDPNNYSHSFGGTSAATPLASGVAALMLSRNPNLTASRIRTILRETCQKIGDEPYTSGRNDCYGYGRIDAHAAVTAAGTGK